MTSQHQGDTAGQRNPRSLAVAILTHRDPDLATAGSFVIALACIVMVVLGDGLFLRLGCAAAGVVQIVYVVHDVRRYLRGGQA